MLVVPYWSIVNIENEKVNFDQNRDYGLLKPIGPGIFYFCVYLYSFMHIMYVVYGWPGKAMKKSI